MSVHQCDDLAKITSMSELAQCADYSLMDTLTPDPDARENGEDHLPRQVFSGHYVPVNPTPLANPVYIAHSPSFFNELGFDEKLATTDAFKRLFSGDITDIPPPIRKTGWATGYALSIYGTEYNQQCPFQTGNGYGDGRAVSVLEAVINGKRWEMQLKGGGRTPYCRGADGRAVLRSSVREFLAQEHMHALGVATSRSLSLFASQSETVDRPWYSEGSQSENPDTMVSNPVAITTRVAPSFLRVGQLELFSRRARSDVHANAMLELEKIVLHIIDREYSNHIAKALPMADKVLKLAAAFCDRLTDLISNWMRVGYCQGNFNSDNTALGGFTLDYGPFGFCEQFNPFFQPWTGGGRHFSFFNQMQAAEKNFETFCHALQPLLESDPVASEKLAHIEAMFSSVMQEKMDKMWATKLGLVELDQDLLIQLLHLMMQTPVDYTVFFRELSEIPAELSALEISFYEKPNEALKSQWIEWLDSWRTLVLQQGDFKVTSEQMKQVNPKFTWREWLVVPAYQQAEHGDYSLVHELQAVLAKPYDEQSQDITDKYYRLRPREFFQAGGVSHYSCSS